MRKLRSVELPMKENCPLELKTIMQWKNFSRNIQHLTNPHAPTQGAEINKGLTVKMPPDWTKIPPKFKTRAKKAQLC